MEHILHTSAKAKVAWSEVCYPKKEGGLGLKDLEVWNISSMLRHVWTLFACAGSIWVAWIQAYMLKGRSFWSVSIPQSCSWCWRKVLKLRFIAKNFIKFEVGDGKMIHLWQDNWHPLGMLNERFGSRVIYDAQIRLDSRLDSILSNGTSGVGSLLGQRSLLIYRVGFLKFSLVLLISRYGLLLVRVPM